MTLKSSTEFSKRKAWLLTFVVILTVLLVRFFGREANTLLFNGYGEATFYISFAGQILYYLVPAVIILLIFHKPSQLGEELGLNKNAGKAFFYAFLFTMPMLIGYMLPGNYDEHHSVWRNLLSAFKDGFREEVFYRAFLFGQLFRRARWGFIPAVAVNAGLFGISHLCQAKDVGDSLAVFGITFAGAVWFAWLFIEWNDNLWLPVSMHFLMNFYWDLFNVSDTAIGGLMLNLPRVLTIALSVIFTIRMIRKRNKRFINRGVLWRQ